MSSLISPESRSLFPLEKIADLEILFRLEFLQKSEPNLALLSIILGAVENSLVNLDYTSVRTSTSTVGGLEVGLDAESLSSSGGELFNKVSKPLLVGPSTPSSKKRGSRGKGNRKSGRHQRNKISVDFKQAKEVQQLELNVGGEGSSDPGGRVDGEIERDLCDESKEEKTVLELEPESKNGSSGSQEVPKGDFPPLILEEVEAMYLKFKGMLVSLVDVDECRRSAETTENVKDTPKELVKKVSDVVWSYLSRSYKADTPHIQSLYTYILGKKLDSFGVALAVAAGCQILGLDDVHLALSEDHAWVIFGIDGHQSAEVTWHGKGIEDKRGQPVGLGEDVNSWLYLKGHAVHCTRHMEVAAIIASINFSINGNMNSSDLIQIQQKLLWELYDSGNLDRYPMALSCLAELEEIRPTPEKKPCISLFQQAVLSARTYYSDMHIYSYTNYAGYLYRQQDYKSALKYWAEAARVVQKYSRSKNDEDIYREFLEISTDYLMNMMKHSSIGFSAHSIMRDPCSFAQVLRFFDGICMWEERSRSPIVHITWAKAWVNAIGKFDYTIRRMVQITLGNADGEGKENSKLRTQQSGSPYNEQEKGKSFEKLEKTIARRSTRNSQALDPKLKDHYVEWNEENASVDKRFETSTTNTLCDSKDSKSTSFGELASVIQQDDSFTDNGQEVDIMAKSSASLLNDLKTSCVDHCSYNISLVAVDPDLHSSSLSCSTFSTVSPSAASCRSSSPIVKGISISPTDSGIDEDEIPSSAVTLHSKKIQQLKDLLKREKYNPAAMTLLLTAQSATSNSVPVNGKQAVDLGSGRPRRERLSQNVDSSKDRGIQDEISPARKRAKLEVGIVNQSD